MQFVERNVGGSAAESDASALRREDSSVEVLLCWSKFPIDRPSASYVGDIAAILLAEEHQVSNHFFHRREC